MSPPYLISINFNYALVIPGSKKTVLLFCNINKNADEKRWIDKPRAENHLSHGIRFERILLNYPVETCFNRIGTNGF